jgi:plasmid maintenance system antidote protein VapI
MMRPQRKPRSGVPQSKEEAAMKRLKMKPSSVNRQTMPESDGGSLENPDVRRAFEEELLLGQVRKGIRKRLEELNLPRRELAQRLRVSEGRISQMLSGGENLTLKSLAGLALALNARFDLTLQDLDQAEHEYEKRAEMDRAFFAREA